MAEPGNHADQTDESVTQAQTEDTKRKFREALDAKKERHHGSEEAIDGGKIHEPHGPAAQKRVFRRKSG